MKAAVLTGKETIVIEERPKPEIGSGEVLVKVVACGICGTDIHAYRSGDFYPAGTIFGHECAGVVAATGLNVSNIRTGDRVVVHPAPACGNCHYCRRGMDNLCIHALESDIGSTPERPGGCAEYLRIPSPEKMIYALPDSVSFEQGALVETLAVAFHSVRQSRFEPGDTAVVLGAGPIGLGVVQFLNLSGAGRIIVVEISSQRSEMARRLGAEVTVNPLTHGDRTVEKILDLTDGLGAHLVYECTGVPKVFTDAVDYLRNGGQMIAVGVIENETPIKPLRFLTKGADLMGSMCYTAEEFQMTIEFVAQHRIDADAMITDIIALADIEEKGFKRLLKSTAAVKILVQP